MASGEESSYQLDSTEAAREQVRELTARSFAIGQLPVLLDAMKAVIDRLKTRPLGWGDPEWRTRKQGGSVCHGIRPPLIVRYVVYEDEKVVCILNVQALPGSPLAE
jgi:hypothetical protein